jgi:hypothetical protein
LGPGCAAASIGSELALKYDGPAWKLKYNPSCVRGGEAVPFGGAEDGAARAAY